MGGGPTLEPNVSHTILEDTVHQFSNFLAQIINDNEKQQEPFTLSFVFFLVCVLSKGEVEHVCFFSLRPVKGRGKCPPPLTLSDHYAGAC